MIEDSQFKTPQIIRTPDGTDFAVIPVDVYNRLLEASEDLSDIVSYDRTMARLQRGDDELVPSDVVDALLDGANPVRVWRKYRGLSLKELAAATGLSQGYLSQIETGKREGKVDALKAIAGALNLTIDDLV